MSPTTKLQRLPSAASGPDVFKETVVNGLSRKERELPGRLLWDEAGSRLFIDVMRSPGYYPVRAEMDVLRAIAPEVARRVGPAACIVEFGSGAADKAAALLDVLVDPVAYHGIDISAEVLVETTERLRQRYPRLAVAALVADFCGPLPSLEPAFRQSVLGFFPGTSLGNMLPADAGKLLARLRTYLGQSTLLVGLDRNRDIDALHTAYASPQMAAFHLNLLRRLEGEGGAMLDREAFTHDMCLLDHAHGLATIVESRLVARHATTIAIEGERFAFRSGDAIRTDISVKYAPDLFEDLVRAAGWCAELTREEPRTHFVYDLLRAC